MTFRVFFSSSGSHPGWDEHGFAAILAVNMDKKRPIRKQGESLKPCSRTCEELQVGEGLRQHPPTLFLHRQGDDHETIC